MNTSRSKRYVGSAKDPVLKTVTYGHIGANTTVKSKRGFPIKKAVLKKFEKSREFFNE